MRIGFKNTRRIRECVSGSKKKPPQKKIGASDSRIRRPQDSIIYSVRIQEYDALRDFLSSYDNAHDHADKILCRPEEALAQFSTNVFFYAQWNPCSHNLHAHTTIRCDCQFRIYWI